MVDIVLGMIVILGCFFVIGSAFLATEEKEQRYRSHE